ncbi:hypothetical protein TI03_00330 [Achromatium sp. WMS1]|nr:hypothetical protein TI03_00330 [Achromatium sp. WMS1]
MSISFKYILPIFWVAVYLLATTAPVTATPVTATTVTATAPQSTPLKSNGCYLTKEQVQEIEFHYDLDRYMVSGCIFGGFFGAITGLLSLSGITIVASVPYIATGCSLGFLLGGSWIVLYDMFFDQT